jgi:hypothetical protein
MPQDLEFLGIVNTDNGPISSSFNFDHIASGPGMKYLISALSSPLIFVPSYEYFAGNDETEETAGNETTTNEENEKN